MRNQIFTRTTAAIIAIAMLMTLALLTTPGNNALGQSLPTVGFAETNVEIDEPDNSPYRANAVLTVRLSQASSQNGHGPYQTEDFTATATDRRLHRGQRHPVLLPRHHRADHQRHRPGRHRRRGRRKVLWSNSSSPQTQCWDPTGTRHK